MRIFEIENNTFEYKGNTWTIKYQTEHVGPSSIKGRLEVVIASVDTPRRGTQLALFICGNNTYAMTSWASQYSSTEIRSIRDQIQTQI